VLMGGGRRYFQSRSDSRNLTLEAQKKGYTVIFTLEDFVKYNGPGPLLGLFSNSHMDYEIDRIRNPTQPSLEDMTRKALHILSRNPKGFLLLVEGGRIDHAGHDNDVSTEARDILAFDLAGQVALEFAAKDGKTLVVQTADHETGGMGLAYQSDVDIEPVYAWYPEVLVKVTASAEFMASQILGGTPIPEVLLEYAGIVNLTSSELALIEHYNTSSSLLLYAVAKVISSRAAIGWTTHGHTGVDVDLYAYSPDADFSERLPSGTMVNSDLGNYFAHLFNLDVNRITWDLRNFNPNSTSKKENKAEHHHKVH